MSAPQARSRSRAWRTGTKALCALLTIAPGSMAIAVRTAATAGPSTGLSLGVVQPRDVLPAGSAIGPPIAPRTELSGVLGMSPRDPAALRAFARSVSTPGGTRFGGYLPPGTFRGRFGPTNAMVAQATGYLAAEGLHPSVSTNGLLVSFSGSVAQVEAAFHTTMSTVRLGSGRQARAATSAIRLPASLVPIVTGVAGLSTVAKATSQLRRSRDALVVPAQPTRVTQHSSAPSSTKALRPSACAAAKQAARGGGPNNLPDPQGLTDEQIASAYGAAGLYGAGANGVGQHVALFELEPFVESNISTFSTCYFGRDLSSSIVVHQVSGGALPGTPASGEADLDIEDIMGVAPGAIIDVYEGPNTLGGVIDTYNTIVQDDVAKIVSTSWGLCEDQAGRAMTAIENTIFEQAAAQGQTVAAASGDSGSNDCADSPSQVTVDDPSSQPFVLAVGGTTITSRSNPPVETTWNGGTFGAGGGGISSLWNQTSWQSPSTVTGVDTPGTLAAAKALSIDRSASHLGGFCGSGSAGAGALPCRQVPDVSLQGDPAMGAITIYFADWGGWTTIGGTSSSAPLWAALLADAASLPACGGSLGFIVPTLYAIASSPQARALAFNDVTLGNNDQGSNRGLFPATVGYDMATGLGTPIMTASDGGVGLAGLLCGSLSAAIPVVDGVSDGVFDESGSITAEVHGSGFGTPSSPSISAVEVGTLQLGPQSSSTSSGFTVSSSTTLSLVIGSDLLPTLSPGVASGAGAHTVVVTTQAGVSSEARPNAVLQVAIPGAGGDPLPSIIGLSTSGGAMSGGQVVTVFGSGFVGATSVTVGGQEAEGFRVISGTRISITIPRYSGTTDCAATGTDPATDICQVHVVVTGPGGASVPQPIASPSVVATPGCGCESSPGADEFDYLAAPVITSVAVTDDALGYAGTGGGTLLTIHGTGIGPFSLLGASFDGSTSTDSWASGTLPVDETTAIVIAPQQQQSIEPFTAEVQIASMATSPSVDPTNLGYVMSNVGTFSYAGVPVLTGLSPSTGLSSGGTLLIVAGQGTAAIDSVDFSGQTIFVGQASGFVSQATVNHPSTTSISLMTPSSLPGPTDLYLCTASGCSDPQTTGTFRYYPPGRASIRKLMTSSGSARGGMVIVMKGDNLGCALKVRFGRTIVAARPMAALTGCGSTTRLKAMVPAGVAGTNVPVQVLTLEGKATGSGYSAKSPRARFTYAR